MATTLWGKVYVHNIYAGIAAEGEPAATRPAIPSIYAGRLQEEPGGRCVFTYDETYRERANPVPIAHTLPIREEPFVSESGLPPFFDNLVAEGWLSRAQARALGVDPRNRFALLLGFGQDLAGAVSVEDTEPREHRNLEHEDEATTAALLGRASLSGVQRKLFLVKDGKAYRPARRDEISTHIAKLPSGDHAGLMEIEFLTTAAVRALLPDQDIVAMEIRRVPAIKEDALIIPRFDRTPSGARRHFEEFSQLLRKYSGEEKYQGSYETMGQFARRYIPAEAYRLMSRVLACLLVGNTDAHYKNFAMFHERGGLRLTPAYDLVAASLYPRYQSIALSIGGITGLTIGQLLPKHLLAMGNGFGIDESALVAAVDDLRLHLPDALAAVENSDVGSKQLRSRLIANMEKRWKSSFELTGPLSSKRRSKSARR